MCCVGVVVVVVLDVCFEEAEGKGLTCVYTSIHPHPSPTTQQGAIDDDDVPLSDFDISLEAALSAPQQLQQPEPLAAAVNDAAAAAVAVQAEEEEVYRVVGAAVVCWRVVDVAGG